MQLTLFSDYTLRTLIYLGSHPGQTVPAAQIAEAFGASSDHLTKAAKWLSQRGLVTGVRGKAGGLLLSCNPAELRVGKLLRQTEPSVDLLECFNRASNTCPIAPACKLKQALFEAREAFFAVLDQYTVADLIENRPQLLSLLRRPQR